jgi:hypothetical protein
VQQLLASHAISLRLEREYPQANTGWSATVVPLQELIVGEIPAIVIFNRRQGDRETWSFKKSLPTS